MRISDWSSDVCSSELIAEPHAVILPYPFGPTPIGNGRIGHLNRGRRFLGPENQLLTRGKPDWRFSRRQISSNADVDRAFEELDRDPLVASQANVEACSQRGYGPISRCHDERPIVLLYIEPGTAAY